MERKRCQREREREIANKTEIKINPTKKALSENAKCVPY